MKKTHKPPMHFIDNYLLHPYNPIPVNLIGAGGTGSAMLTALARINYSLNQLGHPGLFVRVFDDDKISPANQGRQLFCDAEVGLYKSVALINRINRFFGTNWKAVEDRYCTDILNSDRDYREAILTIGCVDTVAARFDIATILRQMEKGMPAHTRNRPVYYMDFGNSQQSGQVLFSTVGKVRQPKSKKFETVEQLPMVTEEFTALLHRSGREDNTPSCSHAEALAKQDLFINSALADMGASLLWQAFREGMLQNRGFFMNLKDYRTTPVPVQKTGAAREAELCPAGTVHRQTIGQQATAA